MKVRDLVLRLERCDPDAEVFVAVPDTPSVPDYAQPFRPFPARGELVEGTFCPRVLGVGWRYVHEDSPTAERPEARKGVVIR